MLRILHDAGFEITPDETEAEIVVINTCGFIESAKQESIDNILDIAWLKENGKCRHIIATGCLVERYREAVMEEMPEVDALVGVGSLEDIAEACRAVMRGEKYTSFKDKETSKLVYKLICDLIGVAIKKSYPRYLGVFGDRTYETRKTVLTVNIKSVSCGILSYEVDLLNSERLKILCLLDYILDRAASESASYEGDCAIGAFIVTALRNLKICGVIRRCQNSVTAEL